MLISSLQTPEIKFDDGKEYLEEKEKFLNQINRGGLCSPSDLCYTACLYSWAFFNHVKANKAAHCQLIKAKNTGLVFVAALKKSLLSNPEGTELLGIACENDHEFGSIIDRIAQKMCNIMMKVYVNEINDLTAKSKKRSAKQSDYTYTVSTRKMSKLQSSSK